MNEVHQNTAPDKDSEYLKKIYINDTNIWTCSGISRRHLILNCSHSSLNLIQEEKEPVSTVSKDEKYEDTTGKFPEDIDDLKVFSNDEVCTTTTGSSSSITREFYLPAQTGSNDTVKLTFTLPELQAQEFLSENRNEKVPNNIFQNIKETEIRQNAGTVNNLGKEYLINDNIKDLGNELLFAEWTKRCFSWKKDIENNKLVMKQDIYETDFSLPPETQNKKFTHSSSKPAECKSCEPSFVNIRASNSFDENSMRSHVNNLLQKSRRRIRSTGNFSPNFTSKTKVGLNSFEQYSSALDHPIENCNAQAVIEEIKIVELPEFFRESKIKHPISKLLISSDVVGEGVGLNSEEKKINPHPTRYTHNNAKYSSIKKRPLEMFPVKSEVVLRGTGAEQEASFIIRNENIPSDKTTFQQIKNIFERGVFNKKNNNYNEMYIIVSKHDDRVKSCNDITTTNTLDNESIFIQENENEKKNLKEEIKTDKHIEQESSFTGKKVTPEENDQIKTTLNIKKGIVTAKDSTPALIFNESGFPLTDLKGRLLKNNREVPLLTANEDGLFQIYDTDKVFINNPDFDPTKRPIFSTLIKITDHGRNPASLYNNLGQPLTDEDGFLLHDSSGNVLVTMDSRFFPLCCKSGMPIYLKNGASWLSHRCKFITTTQHRANTKKSIGTITEYELPNHSNDNLFKRLKMIREPYSSYTVHKKNNLLPHTFNQGSQTKSQILSNKIKSQACYSKIRVILDDILSNKINRNSPGQRGYIEENKYFLSKPIYDIEGNCLTDVYGAPLKNQYGEPMLLYDKRGNPISDCYGGSLFNSKGGLFPSIAPERPYCKKVYKNILTPSEIEYQALHTNPLKLYRKKEPILKIIKRKHIQAWNMKNHEEPKVGSVYSFPKQNLCPAHSGNIQNLYTNTTNYFPQRANPVIGNYRTVGTADLAMYDEHYQESPEETLAYPSSYEPHLGVRADNSIPHVHFCEQQMKAYEKYQDAYWKSEYI